jgi:hypothetical protein
MVMGRLLRCLAVFTICRDFPQNFAGLQYIKVLVTGVAAELTMETWGGAASRGKDMVLTYFGKRRGGAQPAFPAIQEVRAYWEALREGRALPRRDQIDPRGIAEALEQVFLVERIAPGHARFRLAGMHLHDLLGMEARGMPMTALFEPAARARFSEALDTVFTTPAVLDVWLEAERGIGRGALAGRLMLLPVTGSKGEPDLALGCLASEGVIGRVPRRFAISGLVREPLQVVPSDVQAEFAPRPPRGVPHLRLVSSREG